MMKTIQATELEQKYELNCHVNCPFFPPMNSSEIPWKYDETGEKKVRKCQSKYICGYDGHIINSWVDNFCPYAEELKNKKEEEL